MKKVRTFIILLLVFILMAAAFGKEVLAGTSASTVSKLGPAKTNLDFHYDALTNTLQWLYSEMIWGGNEYMPSQDVYVWALTSDGNYGDTVVEKKSASVYPLDDGYCHFSLEQLNPGKYGAAVVFRNRYNDVERTPLIKFTIFAPGECNHLDPVGKSAWSAWKTTTAATCEKDGKESRTCSICNKTETRTIAKLGHKYGSWSTSTKATCEKEGQETRKCSRCGKTETRAITKLGHNWGAWKVTKEASCAYEGEETRTCSRCSKTETRAIAKLPHTWDDWEASGIPPTHGQPIEERRMCSKCYTVELREVPGIPPIAKVGNESIYVVITQELLKVCSDYNGPCDGIFREDLSEVLRKYEKMVGLPETGDIYGDTIAYLADRFWSLLEQEAPSKGGTLYIFEESGLKVDPMRECYYYSNGDGTHRVAPVMTGFDFSWKDETEWFYFRDQQRYWQSEYNEPCRTVNAEMTCDCCGYKDTWQFAVAELNNDFSDIFSGGMILYIGFLDELEKQGLPYIDGLCYEVWNCLTWYGFSGAEKYDVWLVKLGDDDSETLLLEDHTENSFFDLPLLEPGKYGAAVQAKDKDGKAVSDPTLLYFGVQSDTMPMPTNAVLKNGVVTWDYGFEYTNPVFHVSLLIADEGEDVYYETDTKNTWVDLTPVFMEMVAKGVNPQGIQVEIVAKDANGKFKDSEQAYSASEKWMIPSFYRVLCAVNVRSGPGKNYERIGGYSLGDYFIAYDTLAGADGIYYVVNYKGQTGYVLSSCATWFIPKLFTGHVDMGGGKSAEVFTNPDGTIDEEDLANKVTKYGYLLSGLKHTNGTRKGELLELNEELVPGDTFEAVWEADPNFVIVRLVNESGNAVRVIDYRCDPYELTSEIAVPIGETFKLRTPDIRAAGWTVKLDGTEMELGDNTPFTADMTKIVAYSRVGTKVTLGVLPDKASWPLGMLYNSDGVLAQKTRDQLMAYVDKNPNILIPLQKGDVLEILSEATGVDEKSVDSRPRFYMVRVERLHGKGDGHGYVLADLLEGAQPGRYMVWFDANGGICPVGGLIAQPRKGYPYPTLTELPVPSRSGYYFAGWVDEKGNRVIEGQEFTKRTDLKAIWIKYTGYTVKKAITITHDTGSFATQVKPYGFETPSSSKKIELPVCEELQVIGETREMYQCLRADHSVIWVEKRFIAKDYEVYFSSASGWDIFYEHYEDPRDLMKGAGYAAVGKSWYKGKYGTLYYIIGQKGDSWKIAIPDARPKNYHLGPSLGAGVAWKTIPWKNTDTFCTVNFCAGEGVCWLDSVDVQQGQSMASSGLSFPLPCLSGYKFVGWYTDPYLGTWFDANTKVTESMTVYAHYYCLYDDLEAATEKAPIYDRCSTSEGNVLGYVDPGEVVYVQKESKQGKFAWVTHDGISGWVQTRYLKAGAVKSAIGDRKNDMAIRSQGKYKKGTVYRDVRQGELFLVLGSDSNSYYKVAYPCKEGYAYIAKDQLRDPE